MNPWLASDIGASKSDLAIYSWERGIGAPLAQAVLRTADFPSLANLSQAFLGQTRLICDGAIFAVAGPVIDGRVTASVSHLPWPVDRQQLQNALQLPTVQLINDLEAAAWAIPRLTVDDYYTLNAGRPEAHGALAVIAPGTGLGEAFLVWDGEKYRPFASEGGHASFAPTTPEEVELLRYLQKRHRHVSYELVCSGMGIPNIYAFIKESGWAPEPAWLEDKLEQSADPTPVIVEAALSATPCPICLATLKRFIAILAGKAGDLALQVAATGGVYLAGGIPPRLLPLLKQEKRDFLQAFRNKGIMAEVLEKVPIHVITNPHCVRMGAASMIFSAHSPPN